MSDKKRSEMPLGGFFDSLIDDPLERKIIKLISKNLNADEILDILLTSETRDGSDPE